MVRLNSEFELTYKMMKRDSVFADSSALLSDSINELLLKYNSLGNKSAFLATLMSSVIPGLGKFYLGYKYQGRTALMINLVFGIVLVESILNPVSSLYTGLCIANSTVFYIGNIWGTNLLAKKRINDFYNQINEDISDYYNHKLLR